MTDVDRTSRPLLQRPYRWRGGLRRLVGRTPIACAGLSFCIATSVAHSAPAASDALADHLLARMSLAEKIDVIRGSEEPRPANEGEAGYLAGVPRLGLKPLRLADGPPGLLLREPSIAEVATMGVAATFDRDVATRNGVLIADEARRLGIDVVLQPFINMDRDITFIRAYNTFGEDPMLTSVMGVAEIGGIQSRGVLAEAKHYVGYDTDGQNVEIDDRTLHEVYLAPFDAAVAAGVASIMCSYNRVNGAYACGNRHTLTDILRKQLGFDGFVVSDWGAVHDNLGITEGMDMEMPGLLTRGNPFAGVIPSYFDTSPAPHDVPAPDYAVMSRIFEGAIPEETAHAPVDWAKLFPRNTGFLNLSDALAAKTASIADIDQATRRILHVLGRFGRLPGEAPMVVPAPMTQAAREEANRQTSLKSAVLLKNEDAVLPLRANELGDVAVIGPGALQVVAVGKASERSLGEWNRQQGPLAALQAVAGGNTVHAAVADDMDGVVIPAGRTQGLSELGESVSGGTRPAAGGIIDRTVRTGNAIAPDSRIHWSGTLNVDSAGSYWLGVHVLGARVSLFIDGKRVGGTHSVQGALHGDIIEPNQDNLLPTHDGLDNVRVAVSLAAGAHRLELTADPDDSGSPEQVVLTWSTPDHRKRTFDAAVQAARAAKKVVLFLWSRGQPDFRLPGDQDALAQAILAANRNTIVVLNTSQPVSMPWLGRAKAVLEMWWAGDQGGQATADVLTGRFDPAGRLPFTWARALTDYPATDPRHPERSAAGVGGVTRYSEGVDIGYRWFLREGTQPLFPFGFGLSYTRFRYDDLHVEPDADGGLEVRFRLSNIGPVAGEEVPQVYLGAPDGHATTADAGFPIRALAGFVRVAIAAGATRDVVVHVDKRQLSNWSSRAQAWVIPDGARTLSVGASSADLRLQTRLRGRS